MRRHLACVLAVTCCCSSRTEEVVDIIRLHESGSPRYGDVREVIDASRLGAGACVRELRPAVRERRISGKFDVTLSLASDGVVIRTGDVVTRPADLSAATELAAQVSNAAACLDSLFNATTSASVSREPYRLRVTVHLCTIPE